MKLTPTSLKRSLLAGAIVAVTVIALPAGFSAAPGNFLKRAVAQDDHSHTDGHVPGPKGGSSDHGGGSSGKGGKGFGLGKGLGGQSGGHIGGKFEGHTSGFHDIGSDIHGARGEEAQESASSVGHSRDVTVDKIFRD